MKNFKYATLFYLLIFGYLFFFTLNLNYTDRDDATTVLYHLCGRNPEIEPPYAAYNSGLDFIMQYSGHQGEAALREFAIMVTFVSGFFILVLLVAFLEYFFTDLDILNSKSRLYLYLLLPFIIPEIILHSLMVNATNISFAFLLASLTCFVQFLKREQFKFLFFSALFFAIAIPFRWTILVALPVYTGLFLYFHPLRRYAKETLQLLFKIWVSNIAAILLSLVFIWFTGYDFEAMYGTVVSTNDYLQTSEKSMLATLAAGVGFLTPSLLLLSVFGILNIYKRHKAHKTEVSSVLGFISCSILPFVLLSFYPLYKYSITMLPVMLVLAGFGFEYAQHFKYRRLSVLAMVFLPWIIGIQIDAKGTLCGPGFELRADRMPTQNFNYVSGNNPDNRIRIEKIKPAFGSGFYMPMPEGPRSLYGYAYVLFGGGWKNQIEKFASERMKTLDYLLTHKEAVFFQDRKLSFIACDLYRLGFTTKTNFIEDSTRIYRVFKKGKDSITINVVPHTSQAEWMREYLRNSKKTVVYRTSYSNDILKLYLWQSDSVQVVGPFTVIKEK